MLAGKTLTANGYPFKDAHGKKRILYDRELLPNSCALLERTLVYPVGVVMDEEKLTRMEAALAKAAAI